MDDGQTPLTFRIDTILYARMCNVCGDKNITQITFIREAFIRLIDDYEAEILRDRAKLIAKEDDNDFI